MTYADELSAHVDEIRALVIRGLELDDADAIADARCALDELAFYARRAGEPKPYLVVPSTEPLTAAEYERLRDEWLARHAGAPPKVELVVDTAPLITGLAEAEEAMTAYADDARRRAAEEAALNAWLGTITGKPGMFRSWWHAALVAGAAGLAIALVWLIVWATS